MASAVMKRQSGATLDKPIPWIPPPHLVKRLTAPGTLLAAVDKIVGQIGKEVKNVKDPAQALSDAIADFQDAAKDVEVPSGKGGKSN